MTPGKPSGALDCLVNNAAVGKRKLVTDHTAEDLDDGDADELHVADPHEPRRAPADARARLGDDRERRQRRWTVRIVHESAYCAAKFAMTGWSEVAAMDLADTPDRGEADPARRHRHRDLDAAAR